MIENDNRKKLDFSMMRHRYVVGHYASYRQTKLHIKQLEIIVLKPDFFCRVSNYDGAFI